MNRLEEWTVTTVRGRLADVDLVSCPVCGALVLHADTMALARHVLWHHERGEWPWEQ